MSSVYSFAGSLLRGEQLSFTYFETSGIMCISKYSQKRGTEMKKIVAGILAHVDSGKTTLSEALMYRSGSIGKLGRVDHGDSFFDNFALERSRGITIFSKQAVLRCNDTLFTLLDTPGHVDFSAETERTLQVLDYAILVVSGTDGVQSHTATLWKLLKKYNIPCFIFVNKMDLFGAYKEAVLNSLKSKLSDRILDFTDNTSNEFLESAALCDERLLELYTENGVLDNAEIVSAISQRKVFPCFFGSALRLEGIDELLTAMDELTVMPDYPREFGAKVYKISEDEKGSRLTFLKVTGGSLHVKDVLKSSKNTNREKVNQIRIYSGEKYTQTDEATAGTVCAVTGVTFTRSGDGLGEERRSGLPLLSPVLTYSVLPPKGVDSHTLLEKLRILEGEDPQLNVVWNERLKEVRLRLMGDIQLEILRCVIKDRFGIDVEFGTGKIIYKETIAYTVEGVGHFEPLRHYAEVHLIMKPGKRDSGIVINSRCKEDLLDKNWQRLILTHLYEKTHLGILTGSPITDIEITLASGRAHPKHTEGGDFRQATYRAVRQGLRSAESILLEPVYEFTLEVPTENVGRAMTDIQRMSGSFTTPEQNGEMTTISGTAPASTMSGYSREVIAYTHGKGRLSCSLKGYEPCHNAEEVISDLGYDPDGDIENPCDSVFCSHGAGHTVKWNEVYDNMHLPSALETKKSGTVGSSSQELFSKYRTQKDVFALDKELMHIFEQTYGPLRKRHSAESNYTSYNKSDNSSYKRKGSKSYDGTDYLLVDGYNVIFAWDHLNKLAKDNIDAARSALVNVLCNYQGYKKCELILVFDAYKVKGGVGEIEKIGGISVVYTKEAETADMYIEKVSHKLAINNRVRVVTSDGMEQLIILGSGALRVSSRAFLEEVRNAEAEIRGIISGE